MSRRPSPVVKLPYGVCVVRVNDTRIMQTICGGIRTLAGTDADRWLG